MATTIAVGLAARPVEDYVGLAKPRGILPHLVTAAAAMTLAAGGAPPTSTLVLTLVGGGCVAAAANVFNSYLDRDIDARMLRTMHRPLPTGVVKPNQALAFGSILGLAGVALLSGFVDWLAALLAVEALAYYVLPYTFWLKRRTFWSTVIGSGIGANPVLIGWVAITHRFALAPVLLSAIIILWTLPHFWTLAILRKDDYERAGINVLPKRGVAIWVMVCSSLAVAVSLALVPVARLGLLYAGAACLLGAGLVALAWGLVLDVPRRAAMRLYVYSIFYIAALFGAVIIDRLV